MTDENKQDLPETQSPELGEDTTATTQPNDDVVVDTIAQPADNAEPDLTSAFGPMETLDVNGTDFAVLVMCWNLTSNGALGDRQLVNIHSDEEALDILEKEGIPTPVKNEDDLWTTGLGFQQDGKLSNRTQLADKELRLLAVRALHVKFARWDPPVGAVVQKFFSWAAVQQAQAEQTKH